jgi:hypothetical protein
MRIPLRLLRNRRWRAWLVLAGLAAGALLAVGLDAWFVRAGQRVAFRPAGAQWTIEAAGMGEAWRRLAGSEAYAHWRETAGDPLAPVQRSLREGLGIRPTPLRMRVYLGQHVSVSGAAEGVGFSCRPGILLRLISAIHALASPAQSGGDRRWGGWTYAWREGLLIASRSPDYVRAALRAPPYEREAGLAENEVALRWHKDPKGTCRVRLEDAFPITGWFDAALERPEQPLVALGGWPEPPVLTVSAASLAGLETLGRTFAAAAGVSGAIAFLEDQWEGVRVQWQWQALPPDWDAGAIQATAALHAFAPDDEVPVPRISLSLVPQMPPTDPHPLAAAFAAMDPIAMNWAGAPGLLIPIMGEPLGVCLGRTEALWLAASRERLMRRLADRLAPRGDVRGSAVFHLDWRAAAEAGELLAGKAQSWGLLARPAGLATAPWQQRLEALSGMGLCHVTVLAGEGVSRFEGVLAALEPAR